jgi:hypothetical protein
MSLSTPPVASLDVVWTEDRAYQIFHNLLYACINYINGVEFLQNIVLLLDHFMQFFLAKTNC